MECFSTAYLFYMGLQILVVSWTRLFFTAKVFFGGGGEGGGLHYLDAPCNIAL